MIIDPRRAVDALEEEESLDRLAAPAARLAARALDGRVRDILSGVWLGHPAHPLLTDLPIGAFTSASLLDVMGGTRARPAADALLATGLVTALPTVLTGLSDWSTLGRRQQRVGFVHAAANGVGVALYLASLVARRRRRRVQGVVLGFLGATAMTVGGYLGGHLAYRLGSGVNRNAFDTFPDGWTPVAELSALPAGRPVCVAAGSIDVLLLRDGERVRALVDRCSHLGGPLHKGHVEGDTIVCPWHGSGFRLGDGAAVHGPATAPQPALDVRTAGGKVEVRLRPPRAGGGHQDGP